MRIRINVKAVNVDTASIADRQALLVSAVLELALQLPLESETLANKSSSRLRLLLVTFES